MMTDGHVGRLLPACLHQAISEVLPDRLEFYEEWLDGNALRNGTLSMAACSAVVSFLRTEGHDYVRVMDRAGTLAAEWTFVSLPPWRRRLLGGLPRPLRVRGGLRIAVQVARGIFDTSRASLRVRGTKAWLDVHTSLFCVVRDQQAQPRCGFYAAVAVESLRRVGVSARARVEECRAMKRPICRVALELSGSETAPDPAIAA